MSDNQCLRWWKMVSILGGGALVCQTCGGVSDQVGHVWSILESFLVVGVWMYFQTIPCEVGRIGQMMQLQYSSGVTDDVMGLPKILVLGGGSRCKWWVIRVIEWLVLHIFSKMCCRWLWWVRSQSATSYFEVTHNSTVGAFFPECWAVSSYHHLTVTMGLFPASSASLGRWWVRLPVFVVGRWWGIWFSRSSVGGLSGKVCSGWLGEWCASYLHCWILCWFQALEAINFVGQCSESWRLRQDLWLVVGVP